MNRCQLLVHVSLLLVGGCATQAEVAPVSYSIHELTEIEKQKIRADLLAALNASDALFSTVRAAVSSSGEMAVCGWVRLKSDLHEYAIYPDNRPFLATYSNGEGQRRNFRLVH